MKFQVVMEFDESVLPAFHKTRKGFADEVNFLAAAKWYEMGLVSQENAARIAGMNQFDFIMAISHIGLPPFQYTGDEVLKR